MSDNGTNTQGEQQQSTGGETPTPVQDQGKKADTSVPQETVNRLVGEARQSGRDTATNTILENLGVDSMDSLKELVTSYKAQQEANMTELEKLQKQVDVQAAALQTKEERIQDLQADKLNTLRDAKLSQHLRDAHNEQSVLTLIKAQHTDDVNALVNDEGTFDDQKAKALVDAFRSANAYLFKSTAPSVPSNNDGRAPQPDKQARDRARDTHRRLITG